jgi:hypothetical protein
MSAENTAKLLTDQQVATAASICMPVLEGMSNALRAQSEYLRRLEGLAAEMLQRRRAGCAAMQQLLAEVGAARDPTELFRAEQQWLTGALQRMMADASCWQTLAMEDAQRFGMSNLATAFGPPTYSPPQGRDSRMAA